MKLSVIIISYNTKDLTLQSIKSVEDDTSVNDKEIVIIDNDSKDGSVELLKKYSNNKKHIKLILNRENLGFSKANNQGINESQGEYILLLNSDTKVNRGALGKLIAFAESTTDAGVVGAKLLNADGTIQPSCFNFPTITRAIKQYWLRNEKSLDKFAPETTQAVIVDSVVGAAFLITPMALDKVGLLDERYFFFYEDLDYCRRVKENGLKTYYVPSAEIFHLHGASGKKLAKQDNQWKRLIPSSKIYHGTMKHYVFNFILWSGQKWQKLRKH